MITARASIVTIVLVAFVLVLAAMSGEPMMERVEHGCSPPRTMPPSLSRLFVFIALVLTACREALGLGPGVTHLVALRPVAAAPAVTDDRPLPQLRI